MTVNDLHVKVTYRVGLGDVEMPQKVYDQLVEASDKNREIEMGDTRYPEAADWLTRHINEADAMDWEAEIIDITA